MNTPSQNTTVKIPCEVYSRIVGYLRPVQNWNDAKQQEFRDRVVFRVPKGKAMNDMDESHTCADCGNELQAVRPGKWQCNVCEQEVGNNELV